MNKITKYFENELDEVELKQLSSLVLLVGDIHNHCGISYGQGTIEEAIEFAKQQLDFFSVTGHFAWPDINLPNRGMPKDVMNYHKKGFEKLKKNWPHYKEQMKEINGDDLIAFLSYEYHSYEYGDYTVVEKSIDADLPLDPKENEEDLRLVELVKNNNPLTTDVLCFPHHIGYKKGYRGINWAHFNDVASPVVEIVSMHGCSESHDNPFRYLHTMGPRVGKQTMQGGLEKGNHFGVIGCTDHHNASPGSYGLGRTGVWTNKKNRDDIWNSICRDKSTVAYSGDPMELALFVNDSFMGQSIQKSNSLKVKGYVCALDELDKVELLANNKVVYRQNDFNSDAQYGDGWISIAFGWGKKNINCKWDIKVEIIDGEVIDLVPHLRGEDIVAPLDVTDDLITKPVIERDGQHISLKCFTKGNPTTVTNTNQGFALHLNAQSTTSIKVSVIAKWDNKNINEVYTYNLEDLIEPQSDYISGFVSPAIEVGKFNPIDITKTSFAYELKDPNIKYVYLRAFEKNGDFAISSPIWIND
jgi:hypothetical protein